MRDRLPPQYQQLPDDVLLKGLIDQMVDQELLAEALSASPDKDPLTVKLQLDNERRGALAGIAANAAVAGAVDDAKVKAAYDKLVADFKPQPEWNASHILVDSEDKAKALKAEIDGGKDFAEVAQGQLERRLGGERRRPRLVRRRPDGAGVRGGGGGDAAGRRRRPGQDPVRLAHHQARTRPARRRRRRSTRRGRRSRSSCARTALQAKLAELRPPRRSTGPTPASPPAAIRESDLLTN